MNLKSFFRKILQIFRKEKPSYNTRVSSTRVPESPYPEPYTRIRMRYRARNLPKPGSQASHQDISRFFKGKGRQAPWYRKQIKFGVQNEV